MKKILKSLSAAIAVFCIAGCASAAPESEKKVTDQYDFDYMVQSSGIRIVQVFDDGKNTFFQLAPEARVPAIFADTTDGFKFADMELYGPYIKVPFTAKRFMLKINNSVSRVAYVGEKPKDVVSATHQSFKPYQVPEFQTTPPETKNEFVGGVWGRDYKQETKLNNYSYSDRLRGDVVEWTEIPKPMQEKQLKFRFGTTRISGFNPKQFHAMAQNFVDANRIDLTGYDDSSDQENLGKERVEAVANALAAAGIPRSLMRIKNAKSVITGSAKGDVLGVTITGYKAEKYLPAVEVSEKNLSKAVAFKSDANSIEKVAGDRTAGEKPSVEKSNEISKLNDLKLVSNAKSNEVIVWDLKVSDTNVRDMFARWAKNSGYEIVFNEFPVIPVNGDSSFESKDIFTAIDYVLSQSKIAGFDAPIPKLYTDNVIVFGDEPSKE